MAMLAKQAWRLMNNSNSLVTTIMKAKYYANNDFLNANLGNNSSYTWRSIIAVQNSMKQGSRRKIIDGNDTRVWHIPWLPCHVNGYITTDMKQELVNTIVHELMETGSRSWDDDILVDLFNERDRSLIQKIPLSSRYTGYDTWYCICDEKGEFTVRSCYRQIRGEQICEDRTFWTTLWGIKLSGKMLNFIWRDCSNVLPTTTSLAIKNVDVLQSCSWCHVYNEDAVHVLFTCCFTKELWNLVGLQRVVPDSEGGTVLQILKQAFNSSTKEQCVQIGMLCWSLWVRRNNWVWDRKAMSAFGVNAMAVNLFQDWKRVQEDGSGSKSRVQMQQWCKPPPGWIKINIDASCRVDYDFSGARCVVRDENGCFMCARTRQIRGRMQVNEGEARSLREALLWIRQWKNTKCIFETDAKTVVDAIHGGRGNSIFHTIVEDCVEILKHFEEVLVVFTRRSANKVAHVLAQTTYFMPDPMEWYDTAPNFICNLIKDES